jgi:DNA-directed RNA polymerase specialized sigma24 family protein
VIGDQAFAEQFKIQIESAHRTEVPSRERNVPQVALSEVFAGITDRQLRDRRIWEARVCHGYRLIEIAAYLGIHYSTVSKIVAQMDSVSVTRGHDSRPDPTSIR